VLKKKKKKRRRVFCCFCSLFQLRTASAPVRAIDRRPDMLDRTRGQKNELRASAHDVSSSHLRVSALAFEPALTAFDRSDRVQTDLFF
jgi:hypothetical protein